MQQMSSREKFPVFVRTENGWLVSIYNAFKAMYVNVHPIEIPVPSVPYGNNPTLNFDGEKSSKTRKRKKRKIEKSNKFEDMMRARHAQIRNDLVTEHERFLSCWDSIYKDSNVSGVGEKFDICEIVPWLELADATCRNGGMENGMYKLSDICESKTVKTMEHITLERKLEHYTLEDPGLIFNNVLESPPSESFVSAIGRSFVLPCNCAFQISDIANITNVSTSFGPIFRFIIIDFPWENRSQQRSSSYSSLPNFDAFKLPIEQLAHPEGCVVVMWLTNRGKLNEFVVNDLFPFWKVKLIGVWNWLKLVGDCEYVSDLDSPHRRPYEPILIGVFGKNANKIEQNMQFPMTIGSKPTIHSRKPPLQPLLESMNLFGENDSEDEYKGIELFARSLAPYWVSWGNETLKFQCIESFT